MTPCSAGKMMTRLLPTALAALIVSTGLAVAQDKNVECQDRKQVRAGKITVVVKSVGVFVGVRWGKGEVVLDNGKTFSISFSGGKAMEFGAAELHLEGTVYNLEKVADFPGTFAGVGGGVTAADEGVGMVTLTNGKCVSLEMTPAESEGLRASMPIAPGAVDISIDEG